MFKKIYKIIFYNGLEGETDLKLIKKILYINYFSFFGFLLNCISIFFDSYNNYFFMATIDLINSTFFIIIFYIVYKKKFQIVFIFFLQTCNLVVFLICSANGREIDTYTIYYTLFILIFFLEIGESKKRLFIQIILVLCSIIILEYTNYSLLYFEELSKQEIENYNYLIKFFALSMILIASAGIMSIHSFIRKELEESNLAKTQFLSTISHEIRTPLNGVIGITNLLIEENPKQEQIENLEILKFSAENLLNLINDVLDYNKLEAGKIEFEKINFNLHELLKSIKNSFKQISIKKDLLFIVEVPFEIPQNLIGDPTRLSQIINNLIANSFKFTENGFVKLMIEILEKDEKQIRLKFSIIDSGIGIEENKIETIFEKFTQASTDTTRKFGGTGLGLSIVKKLLIQQNSNIFVESIFGEKTNFYFELEFEYSNEEIQKEKKVSIDSESKNLFILIVEDNIVNQKILTKMLNSKKFPYKIAENGVQAIELIQENNFDIVLMDLQMPIMDGFTATKKIRELGILIPIIAVSASTLAREKEDALNSGMNDFISKPYKKEEIFLKIHEYTNQSR